MEVVLLLHIHLQGFACSLDLYSFESVRVSVFEVNYFIHLEPDLCFLVDFPLKSTGGVWVCSCSIAVVLLNAVWSEFHVMGILGLLRM